MRELKQQIDEAVAAIREKTEHRPVVGLILGTGLGDISQKISSAVELPYEMIPHFPKSTVQGHAGRLVLGDFDGTPVVAMEGRFHFYEGYSLRQVTFPVRVMRGLGANTLVVTNAAGGMNPQFELADVMIIEDHINLLPDNPLRGVNDESLGPRFPDMSAPYDRELIQMAQLAGRQLGLPLQKGVLVAVAGPNLETRAEYRMLRGMGADTVAMSTVPEVIVARHAGMRVLAFSVVTDLCLPDALEEVSLEKILEVAGRGGAHLGRLLTEILPKMGNPAETGSEA